MRGSGVQFPPSAPLITNGLRVLISPGRHNHCHQAATKTPFLLFSGTTSAETALKNLHSGKLFPFNEISLHPLCLDDSRHLIISPCRQRETLYPVLGLLFLHSAYYSRIRYSAKIYPSHFPALPMEISLPNYCNAVVIAGV